MCANERQILRTKTKTRLCNVVPIDLFAWFVNKKTLDYTVISQAFEAKNPKVGSLGGPYELLGRDVQGDFL